MNKKEFFYKYTDFTTLQNIGAGWVSQIKQYIPTSSVIIEAAALRILISSFHINISTWAIIVFLVGKYYAMMALNWAIGKLVIRVGIYKAQQQYGAKKEHLAPYELEHRNTIINIAKAVGAKSEYTDL